MTQQPCSTVSAAGEPRTDLSRFSTPSAKALMEWADSARRGPDVLTLRRTLVATLPRIEAEAAESRPSVTERPDWLIAVIEEHTFDSSRGGRCSCGEWPAGGERYHTEHLASKIAAASPAGPGIRNRLLASRFDPSVSLDELIGAGPEAVPQSEPEGLRAALERLLHSEYYTGDLNAEEMQGFAFAIERVREDVRADPQDTQEEAK